MDLDKFIGAEGTFPLEHRILNTVVLIGIALCLFTAVSNYVIGFELPALISVFCGLMLGAMYYFSVVRKAYRLVLAAGVGLAFATFAVLWFVSDGIHGATPYYMLIFAAMVTVSVRSKRLIAVLAGGLAAEAAALIATQYVHPQAVAVAASRGSLYADNFIGIMAALVVITSLYVIILDYYRREQARATDYLVKLEKQEMALEMARLDRLNLIGEMAAGIGHEVRNPLTTVRGFLQLFRNREEFARNRDHFDLMIGELDRANAIITEFLGLAKNKSVSLAPCNLNPILERIFPLIQANGLQEGKEVVLRLKRVPRIEADEREIRQLVLNLAGNALDATEPGGRVTIGTFRDGNRTVLFVHDTGKGIPAEIYAKLGTPFVTDKEKGTGLGIPICYRIAERHRAKIEVDTGEQGTTFRLRFNPPRRRDEAAAQA